MLEQKSSKTVDREKNKSKRRTRRTISQKSSSKTGWSYKKNFCQNKLSISQSNHFWYRAFTNSSMESFDRVPVLEILIWSYTQEVFPGTFRDESSIEFQIETDRNLFSDLRDTHLSLKLQLFKGRLFDAFKKEKAQHKAKSEDGWDEEPHTYFT